MGPPVHKARSRHHPVAPHPVVQSPQPRVRDGTEDVLLVGYDGTEEATVAQNPYKMGLVGVKEAVNAAKDESVPKTINTGVTLVTPENAKSYL